jgi:hypothetical protein
VLSSRAVEPREGSAVCLSLEELRIGSALPPVALTIEQHGRVALAPP